MPGLKPRLEAVIIAEQIKAAHVAPRYPWDQPDDVISAARDLRDLADRLTASIDPFDAPSYASLAKDILGDVEYHRLTDPSNPVDEILQVEPAPASSVVGAPQQPRSFFQLMLDSSLLITTTVGAVVVALVGYQSQFLSDASFNADGGDYLRLAAWAFAIQVAGTTLLTIAGKLTTTRDQAAAPS